MSVITAAALMNQLKEAAASETGATTQEFPVTQKEAARTVQVLETLNRFQLRDVLSQPVWIVIRFAKLAVKRELVEVA